VAVEIKSIGDKPTPAQLQWLATFAALPCGRAWVLTPRVNLERVEEWIANPETAPAIYGWSLEDLAA
jgi:hypothetical protein